MGLHLLAGYQTEEQKKRIADDINETDDAKLGHNMDHLAAWVKTQPHLPQNYDHRLLRGFLRGCKHNLDICKRKIDVYFSIRNTQAELFQNRDPEGKEIQKILSSTEIAPVSKLSPDGCRIVYYRWLPADYELLDLFRVILMISDIRLMEEPLIRGDIFVWDMAEFKMATLSKLMATPSLKKILLASQEAYPQRLQQIHLINCSPVAERVANFFKMFMKPKMRNRWFLHSDHESLPKYLPPDCIPKEYGGTVGSMHFIHEAWTQKLYEYSDWFAEQETVATDESKRPADGEGNKHNMLEEMKGTFRQIQFD